MASTYVAGGDLEYGRYGNPTWAAFEEALGELEGGRALAFASGLAAVATILDLVGVGAKVVAPRHAYLGSIGQLADLEARGRIKAELVDVDRHRRGRQGVRGRRAGVAGVADEPGPRGRRHRRRSWRPAHDAGAYVVVDNTFATPAAAAAAVHGRRPGGALGDEVHRRAQRRAAGCRGDPRRAAVRRTEEAPRHDRRDPGHVRDLAGAAGSAHPARAAGARAGQRPGAGAPARGAPGGRRGPLPRLRRDRRDRPAPGVRWQPTCSPTRRRCGCTPPASAASSRPSSDADAGRPSRRPSPTAWCGCRSASRTSTTSGTTWPAALDDLTLSRLRVLAAAGSSVSQEMNPFSRHLMTSRHFS